MSSNAVSAQGTKVEISSDGTSFTEIKEVKTYSGFDGQASDIDVTNLQSTAKEYRVGIQDFGTLQLDVNVVRGDAGQTLVRTALASGAVYKFQVTLNDAITPTTGTGTILAFDGLVKQFTQQGGVDAVQAGTIQVRITGAVTVTAAT